MISNYDFSQPVILLWWCITNFLYQGPPLRAPQQHNVLLRLTDFAKPAFSGVKRISVYLNIIFVSPSDSS